MDSRIRVALNMLDEQQADSAVCLTSIISLLGLSPARFHKLFKLWVGKSLCQYMREARMAKAMRLLEQHHVPIKEVALKCGYEDVSNFYRDFRRTYGTTPLGLRQLQLSRRIGNRPPGTGPLRQSPPDSYSDGLNVQGLAHDISLPQ